MKLVLLVAIFLLANLSQLSQTVDKTSQIEQVQIAISKLSATGNSSEIMLNDFTQLKGKVTALAETSFNLKIKGSNRKKGSIKILYSDVIEIKSKNVSASFIPDPSLRSFGSWNDVLKINYNHNLEVVLENGEIVSGRLGEMTKDKLSLLAFDDNKKLTLLRKQIVYLYKTQSQRRKTKDSAFGGANKGRKIGEEIGPTAFGKVLGAAVGTIIGAGVGAVAGSTKEEGGIRLLIYSK